MDTSIRLEIYLRHAFGVDRSEDPARVADQSYLAANSNLDVAKAAIGYATLINIYKYNTHAEELERHLHDIMNAQSITAIDEHVGQINVILAGR